MYQWYASIRVSKLHVDVGSDRDGMLVTATYELETVDPRDRRPLYLAMQVCPFRPVSITCPVMAGHMRVPGGRALGVPRGQTWHRARLEVVLRYDAQAKRPVRVPRALFVVPSELPWPAGARDKPHLPVRQVWLGEQAERHRIGFLGVELDRVVERGGPYLQAILRLGDAVVDDHVGPEWPAVSLVAVRDPSLLAVREASARRMLTGAATFFAQRLAARPDLHLAALIDATDADRGGSDGPLILQPGDQYGNLADHVVGYPLSVAQKVASSWWGRGFEMDWPNEAPLLTGLRWAAGLSYTVATAPPSYADLLLTRCREYLRVRASRERRLEEGDLHIVLGWPLYEWLAHDATRWTMLGEWLRDGWGRSQSEASVLEWFERAGVDLEPTLAQVRRLLRR